MKQDPDKLVQQALSLYRGGRPEEAKELCRIVLTQDDSHVPALYLLGVLAMEGGNSTEAIRFLTAAAEAQDPRVHSALATVMLAQRRPKDAVKAARRAVALAPAQAEYLFNLGNALQRAGDMASAERAYRRALVCRPDLVNCHWNLALLLLRAGRFAEGWREYEWRWQRSGAPLHYRTYPCWDGGSFRGKTVLLYAEQGLGDALQFSRYLPAVLERGGEVVLECPVSLIRLIRYNFPGIAALPHGSIMPPFDLQLSLPSLPQAFATTLDTIPAPPAYLSPPPGETPLPAAGGLKVGLVWGGSPNKPERDVPLAAFAPLLAVPGIAFFSLQLGPHAAALATTPGAEAVVDLAPQIGDFADTARLASQLDLIITVDTSVAHLAGALGRPVWILLEHLADWRWLIGRTDSPWYPTARLFRQSAPGDWAAVVTEAAAALRSFPRPPA